jgi:hypothetical protein
MSKRKIPEGLPPIPEPIDEAASEPVPEPIPPEVAEPEITVEQETYQLEQETVSIMSLPPTCPRCGSTERTPLKEISPRIYTDRGCVIRYRTQCLGRINPVDKDGKPMVDNEGKPLSYVCGNRYKVKNSCRKFVSRLRKSKYKMECFHSILLKKALTVSFPRSIIPFVTSSEGFSHVRYEHRRTRRSD